MLLLNFFPVSAGGGLQNSLSFLKILATRKLDNLSFIVVCRKNSLIEKKAIEYGFQCVSFSGGMIGRILFEILYGRKISRQFGATIVFTLFGNSPLTLTGVKTISGFAYSNIIQPEIDFWKWLPFWQRLKKKVIDFLRYRLALQTDILILETEYLYERALNGVFKGKDLRVVKMAPSQLVVDVLSTESKVRLEDDLNDSDESWIDIIYLSGSHPNKRIHLLAPIFKQLVQNGNYRLITTLSEGSYLDTVIESFAKLGITRNHVNIGPIEPANVADVIRDAQGMINVASLESFSNNWVEAWAANVPLITTDAEWAKASCQDAAIYVEINDPMRAANCIDKVFSSVALRKELVVNGKKILLTLPTAEQRVQQYLDIISSCYGESK